MAQTLVLIVLLIGLQLQAAGQSLRPLAEPGLSEPAAPLAMPGPPEPAAPPAEPVLPEPAAPLTMPGLPEPAAPLAIEANRWYDGPIQYSQITNCVSIIQGLPYQEAGAGAYVGFVADPDAGRPAPNLTYYVHVVVAGLGNSCSGMRAYIDLALPGNTTLAIDATNRVRCFFDGGELSTAECPQSLPASAYNPGSYWIPSTDGAHANLWPIPQGRFVEIQVPVRSSTTLSDSKIQANVWMLDGNSSPWLRPQQGVYVFSSQPTILYPSPSTTAVTSTGAHSEAYLYAFGTTGTGYFDLGATQAYGLIHDAVTISTPGTAWLVWDDWGPPALQPDTLYHWRFTYTTGGQTYYGADQTFRTLADGRVTVGQGQAAGCTETALNNALATAKEIWFDCGPLPVEISMSSPRTLAASLKIDGGNKVTLAATGAGNHFTVPAGVHLTLADITLSNGVNSGQCGGAVRVLANGQLTLDGTRFVNNRSNQQGGAVCNNGATNIAASLFVQNSSVNSHGGAIGNYGTLSITDSKFMTNTAAINGGAIDMGGTVQVSNSSFSDNKAGFRGGGINTYGGTLMLTESSFTGNQANVWGGGLASDNSITTVTGSSFRENVSANVGGGIEISGAGSLALTNSTVSANRATNGGAGLFWYPGVGTGPVTILNSTFVSNVSQTPGGNIYAGGPANPNIRLKNTILASGSPDNCDNTVTSYGNNLESANTCGLTAGGDKINTNAKLGAGQATAGGTWSHLLLPRSPAIDAGANAGCPAIDQRGVTRPIDGNRDGIAACDIGAIEATSTGPVFLPYVRR